MNNPAPPKKFASTGFAALVTKSGYARLMRKRPQPSAQRWKPRPYQLKCVEFLVQRSGAALLLDPGLGKTSISYAACKTLKNAGHFRGALVVAPRRVASSVWPQEAAEWKEFEGFKVVVLHGDHKNDRVNEPADFYVINYEGLPWLVKSGNLERMLRTKKVNVLIIDELSKVKHIDSSRHKIIASVAHRFSYRWGLTGSPASNGLLDLFGQIWCLDLGTAFGQYFTLFRFNFFTAIDPKADFPVWVPKPGATKFIYEALKEVAIRIDARKHVKMPKPMLVPVRCELEPKHRAMYDMMEEDFFAVVEEGKELITGTTASSAHMKCRQIATGAVYEDPVDPLTGMPRTGTRRWTELHDTKLEALQDRIDELQGQQLLIVYEFGHDRERILKLLGPDTPIIGGGISDKRALAYEAAWNAGEIPYMLIHPQSGAHGLNFQKSGAHHIFFYTCTYDYELYDQMVRRLMRSGNNSEYVFVHVPVTKDTVEEAVMASLNSKRRTQDDFHRALEEYRLRRRMG